MKAAPQDSDARNSFAARELVTRVAAPEAAVVVVGKSSLYCSFLEDYCFLSLAKGFEAVLWSLGSRKHYARGPSGSDNRSFVAYGATGGCTRLANLRLHQRPVDASQEIHP